MLKKENIVVFDFDGTLSASDANAGFMKYCFRHSVRPWLFLPIVFTGFVARYLFGMKRVWWRECARRYLTPDMVKRLAPGFVREHKKLRFGWAKNTVNNERNAGRRVLLISAGVDYLVPHLISDIKFDAVITSTVEPKQPWKYKFLCYKDNKVAAMDEWAKKHKCFPNIVRAYSDSLSDLPIMELAAEEIWVNPKTGTKIKK